jgi:hypothetical protein
MAGHTVSETSLADGEAWRTGAASPQHLELSRCAATPRLAEIPATTIGEPPISTASLSRPTTGQRLLLKALGSGDPSTHDWMEANRSLKAEPTCAELTLFLVAANGIACRDEPATEPAQNYPADVALQ